MKPWPLHFLLAFLLLTVASTTGASAQDAGMSELEVVEESESSENDKSAFVPGEDVRYVPQTTGKTQARDSLMLQMHDFPMQQATMKPAERSSDKQSGKPKDDSILTFNFLYYIIQKYKLQDIID